MLIIYDMCMKLTNYLGIDVCVYVYIYVCVYIYMYNIYICIYIYIYITIYFIKTLHNTYTMYECAWPVSYLKPGLNDAMALHTTWLQTSYKQYIPTNSVSSAPS